MNDDENMKKYIREAYEYACDFDNLEEKGKLFANMKFNHLDHDFEFDILGADVRNGLYDLIKQLYDYMPKNKHKFVKNIAGQIKNRDIIKYLKGINRDLDDLFYTLFLFYIFILRFS